MRLFRTCGHGGCCDDSAHRHAIARFHVTRHPIIAGYDPPEGSGWCYVDAIKIDVPDQTDQLGAIPRHV